MLYFFNLAINFLFPGLIEWWSRWNAAIPNKVAIGEADYANALAALAGILILGLGGVLIIGFSGRWVRRWIFKSQNQSAHVSPDSLVGKMEWARQTTKSPDETSSPPRNKETD